ncbi:MAG: hypothetical protein J0H67_03430, partial [Rhodospirillales bacterium]|nr:hypothetical protein [Rhodospirillales bacterium]
MTRTAASEEAFARFVTILGRGPGRSRALTQEEARAAFGLVLAGEADPHQVGAFLMLLRFRGEDAGEIAGLVEAIRDDVVRREAAAGGGVPPEAAAFTTILGYVMYIGLVVCVLSIIGVAALFIWRGARGGGDGAALTGRLGLVLVAVALISGASSLVAFLLPSSAPGGSVSATGFLQNSLWYYVGGLAVVSVIVGAIRMAWEQRANPGKELLQSIMTLIVVAGAGLTFITLAAAATDAFSVWVLNNATGCDVTEAGESNCFGTNIMAMIALTSTSPVGLLGVLILAVVAFLMTIAQVALMVIRGGLLVVLAGVLPLTASFTN